MNFKLIPLREENIKLYKDSMRESFQKGSEEGGNPIEFEVLPESHIDKSLNTKGAIAYEALVDDEFVGGAVVVINEETQYNHLDFLFVKYGVQSKGIGQKIWKSIEELHPNTKIWETYTPYFERRNIHFYVNRCKFKIVEYFNENHLDPKNPFEEGDDFSFDGGMFRFEKKM